MAGARSKSTYPNKVFSLMWSEVLKSFHLHLVRSTNKFSVSFGTIWENVFSLIWSSVIEVTRGH